MFELNIITHTCFFSFCHEILTDSCNYYSDHFNENYEKLQFIKREDCFIHVFYDKYSENYIRRWLIHYIQSRSIKYHKKNEWDVNCTFSRPQIRKNERV